MLIPFHKSLLAANDVKAPRVARRSLKAPEFPRLKERAVTRLRSKRTRNEPEPVAPGEFTAHTYGRGAAIRAYKLYVPALHSARPRPLLMMLHGCQQNPDDFAAGTRMNELADVHGFLVAYPAQTSRSNSASCWTWFEALEQEREGVEPSQLAGIVGAIAETHDVDMGSVFVAGLSAGAAMAVILGETYPEIFAAVGAHSGLPWGAAHNVLSAFFAMQEAIRTERSFGWALPRRELAARHGTESRPSFSTETVTGPWPCPTARLLSSRHCTASLVVSMHCSSRPSCRRFRRLATAQQRLAT